MKRKVGKKSADRISELPVFILHRILTFLPLKDAMKTSLLSKQWNSIQKCFPILEFNHPYHMRYLRSGTPEFKEKHEEFLDFVERSLQNFIRNKLSMEKIGFRVACTDEKSVQRVNTWSPLALHNGVSALSFCFERFNNYSSGENLFYPLPETTFSVNSTLLSCSSKFFCLQKLELSKVVLSENILRDIVQNCPNLSDLSLLSFFGLKSLNLSKVDKLVSLTITAAEYIELTSVSVVGALSLKRFSLMFDHHLESCPIDLTSCYNLTELKLRHTSLTDASFNLLISRLPLLEVLDVSFYNELQLIRISLQRLKHLELAHRLSLKAIEIDAPVLSKFVLTPDGSSDLPVMVLADVNPGSLYLDYCVCTDGLQLDTSWFLEIRERLTAPFKCINLSLGSFEEEFAPEELNFRFGELSDALIPPLVEVDCLDLAWLSVNDTTRLKILLEGLLWSCHPKTILMTMRMSEFHKDHCIKILCEMLNEKKCQLCCNMLCCKCWRHRLKAVKIVNKRGIEFHKLSYRSVIKKLSEQEDNEVRFVFDWDHSA